ncbi:MAG TPA: hypothetical protein VIK72_05050 [Clostridiaceae bacterium]
MKRVIKIIKAYWFMNTGGLKWLFVISIIFAGIISLFNCALITWAVFKYSNSGEITWVGGFYIQVMFLINLAYILSFNLQGVIMWKGRSTGNLNNFLIQAPILKEDIYTAKFSILQISGLPVFITIVYLVGLNIFVRPGELVASYTGLLTLIYCIWNIAVGISIRGTSLLSKRYKVFGYIVIALLIMLIIVHSNISGVPLISLEFNLTTEAIWGVFPRDQASLIMACRYISGFFGIILLIIAFVTSYFLGGRLSLKRSSGLKINQ